MLEIQRISKRWMKMRGKKEMNKYLNEIKRQE